VKPDREGFVSANGGGLPGEDEKGGLKGVLGVVSVAQHLPADAEHKRTVSLQEGGEGSFIASSDELLQQVRVVPVTAPRGAGKSPEVTQDSR
jgi:hypothetical protein